MKNFPLLAASIWALASCAPREGAYPASAKPFLARNFQWDGKIHSLRHGDFHIAQNTIFCTYRPGKGLDSILLNDALKSLGRPMGYNGAAGSFGGGQRPSPDCRGDGANNPVFVRGEMTTYRTSYRIAIAVWQGDALWVGVIERLNGMRRDAVAGDLPVNDGPSFYTLADYEKKARRENSRHRDNADLTRVFLRTIKQAGHQPIATASITGSPPKNQHRIEIDKAAPPR